jgi:superoxide dismutase, Cu-Zn family
MENTSEVRKTAAAGVAAVLTTAVIVVVNSATSGTGAAPRTGSLAELSNHSAVGQIDANHRAQAERVKLHDVEGDTVGWVTLRQRGSVVTVSGWFRDMAPGFHGFHIHATGLCEADAPDGPFTTAGGHHTGGAATTHGDHAGDMPSLLVMESGRAFTRFRTDRYTVASLRDADGSAVMVHEGRDNFANIPERYSAAGVPGPDAATLATGDAGARAACGVID